MSNEHVGVKVLDFLRDIHEREETPESCDVDELFNLIGVSYDSLTKLSPVTEQINIYLAQCPPHVRERAAAKLLCKAKKEIERLIKNV